MRVRFSVCNVRLHSTSIERDSTGSCDLLLRIKRAICLDLRIGVVSGFDARAHATSMGAMLYDAATGSRLRAGRVCDVRVGFDADNRRRVSDRVDVVAEIADCPRRLMGVAGRATHRALGLAQAAAQSPVEYVNRPLGTACDFARKPRSVSPRQQCVVVERCMKAGTTKEATA